MWDEALVWGSVSVAGLTLLMTIGVFLVPLLPKDGEKPNVSRVLAEEFLVALAATTLTSDALLHLVPEMLGMNDEQEEVPTTNNSTSGTPTLSFLPASISEKSHLFKFGTLIGTVYVMYLMQAFGRDVKNSFRNKKPGAQALIHPEDEPPYHSHSHSHSHLSAKDGSVTSLAVMLLLGDGIHHFADSLAIGAAFNASINSGFATTVAVALHEIPHQLGAFVVLLSTGLSPCQAVLLNLLTAIPSFFGLYVGIELGRMDYARPWIFAVTAGVFIYIAWFNLFPHLKERPKTEGVHWLARMAVQILSLLLGFGLIFSLSYFGEFQLDISD